MLEQIREFSRLRIVRWLFILFLVVPFGLFGIDAYLTKVSGPDAVASVGKRSIGTLEFDQALRQQADMYRQQFKGNFDPALMESAEMRGAVLDRLVNERLLVLGAERAGVRMSDRELAQRIAAEPFFQVDGRFSKERYEQIARAQNLTPLGLDERLREDYRQQDFRRSIVDTTIVPRATLDSFIRLSEQTREVSVVNLGLDAQLAKVQVTPEQVKAHYEANAARFTTPEQVRIEYVELSVDALAAQGSVPPEEVKRTYDEEVKAGRHGQKEERRASHVLVTVKPDAPEAEKKAALEKANAIAERVRKSPASFADVAKKESQDPGSAPQGGDLGFFSRGSMVKAFEDATFQAKKGEIVGPVTSEFGHHVILVTDIKPEKVKSFAEAAPEIEVNLRKQAAARRFAEMSESFANIVYEQPDSLKPAAEQFKLPIRQSGWIQKGVPQPSPILGSAKFLAEIFSEEAIKAKRNTPAVEAAPSVLVSARVLEHRPAERRPLETVEAEIRKRLQREEALKLVKAEGEAKLKELQEGKDAGLKWPAPLEVNRQKPGGLFPQVVDRVFRVDGKKLPAYVGADTPVGYALVRVTKVIEPEKIEEAKRQALGAQLRQAVAAQELEATLGSLRDRVGVKVRKDALEKKTGN